MRLSTAGRNRALDAIGALVTHVSLHTAFPFLTGASEVSGSGYARQAVTLPAAASGRIQSTTPLTFDVPAGTFRFFGLWDSLSGGNFCGWGFLQATTATAGFGRAKVLDGDGFGQLRVSSPNFMPVLNDQVVFENADGTTSGGGIPVPGTVYFIVSPVVSTTATDTFRIAATLGGLELTITNAADEWTCTKVVGVTRANAGKLLLPQQLIEVA